MSLYESLDFNDDDDKNSLSLIINPDIISMPIDKKSKKESLVKDETRYAILPIVHRDTWDYVEKSYASYWVSEEIQHDLVKDIDDVKGLNDAERHLLLTTLSFFATGDTVVNQNLNTSFYEEIEENNMLEAVYFYDFQRMIENVHARTYSMLLEAYVEDDTQKIAELNDGIKNNEFIKRKAEWCLKHFGAGDVAIDNDTVKHMLLDENCDKSQVLAYIEQQEEIIKSQPSFAERLIAQACTELISFSGSFCVVFWFARRNRFRGLKKANQLISRDEGLHGEFAAHMFRKMGSPLSFDHVKGMVEEFVNIEIAYINHILPHGLPALNAESMTTYIKFIANQLMGLLGFPIIYKNSTQNPFDFMKQINNGIRTTDFFTNEVTEYSKAGSNISPEDQELCFD